MTSLISLDDPSSLVNLHVYSTVEGDPGLAGQAEERVQLVRAWSINPGERILELGCGQGDTTIALAVAVGDQGKIVAIDPAPLDYGEPRIV
jgi:precorrin-6B methylase 2